MGSMFSGQVMHYLIFNHRSEENPSGDNCLADARLPDLVTRPKYPPYRETGVAIPLSHCVSCRIADYRCYTPTPVRKSGLSQSNDRPNEGVSQKKLASDAYRAIGGVARNSIANRAIVGHQGPPENRKSTDKITEKKSPRSSAGPPPTPILSLDVKFPGP